MQIAGKVFIRDNLNPLVRDRYNKRVLARVTSLKVFLIGTRNSTMENSEVKVRWNFHQENV